MDSGDREMVLERYMRELREAALERGEDPDIIVVRGILFGHPSAIAKPALDALDRIEARLSPSPPSEPEPGVRLDCRSDGCSASVRLPVEPDGVMLIPAAVDGWTFATDTGWRCPGHATPTGEHEDGE